MAKLTYPNGKKLHDIQAIKEALLSIGVTLRHWALPEDENQLNLLQKSELGAQEKDSILQALDHRFENLKLKKGYTTRDLIDIHENMEDLDAFLAQFSDIHHHSEDEVRYIVAGKGYFGLVDKQNQQVMLEVVAGDFINIPANVEHWFELGDSKQIKAVRYFINESGWTPTYTSRSKEIDPVNTVPTRT